MRARERYPRPVRFAIWVAFSLTIWGLVLWAVIAISARVISIG